jgi:hypothetical protein
MSPTVPCRRWPCSRRRTRSAARGRERSRAWRRTGGPERGPAAGRARRTPNRPGARRWTGTWRCSLSAAGSARRAGAATAARTPGPVTTPTGRPQGFRTRTATNRLSLGGAGPRQRVPQSPCRETGSDSGVRKGLCFQGGFWSARWPANCPRVLPLDGPPATATNGESLLSSGAAAAVPSRVPGVRGWYRTRRIDPRAGGCCA